jgi:hypothetical protein
MKYPRQAFFISKKRLIYSWFIRGLLEAEDPKSMVQVLVRVPHSYISSWKMTL